MPTCNCGPPYKRGSGLCCCNCCPPTRCPSVKFIFVICVTSGGGRYEVRSAQCTIDVMGPAISISPSPTPCDPDMDPLCFELRMTEETIDAIGRESIFEMRMTEETIDAIGRESIFEMRMTEETIDVLGRMPSFTPDTSCVPASKSSTDGLITISDNTTATVYPSTITISGFSGTISYVTVTLNSLSHDNPDDIDILLVGPTGTTCILMSDTGGTADINSVNLTFDDSASALPDSTQITSGTYQPTNFGGGDTFAAPSPIGPYGSTLAGFIGTDPNGVWSLYIVDDSLNGLTGTLTSWNLNIFCTDTEVRASQETLDVMGINSDFEVRESQETIDVMGSGVTCCSTLTVTLTTTCPSPCGLEVSGGRVFSIGAQPVGVSYMYDTDCFCLNSVNPVLINGQVPPVDVQDGDEIIVTLNGLSSTCSLVSSEGPICVIPFLMRKTNHKGSKYRYTVNKSILKKLLRKGK